MGPEQLDILQDCEALAGKLLSLLERDRQEMPGCIGGEILTAYRQSVDSARSHAASVRTSLRDLIGLG